VYTAELHMYIVWQELLLFEAFPGVTDGVMGWLVWTEWTINCVDDRVLYE
jgi:hypothetical protein